MKDTDREKLKIWFLNEKRDLPWRQVSSPYAVWISEVMLQQTQVAVVIPYFERWMERFPTIHSLAQAPLDDVIKAWEGLGYYSRARNLHEGAKQIVEKFAGSLPEKEEELQLIKGLGPYTIGAIRSFAFHQRCSAVDGNVMRVLCRYYRIADDISKPRTQARLRQVALDLLPEEEPWIVNEALIELGATVCKKKPQCLECPLRNSCEGFLQGSASELPYKSVKYKIEKLYRSVAVLRHGDEYLVQRGKKGKIMSDLHEFVYADTDESGMSREEFEKWLETSYGLRARAVEALDAVKHGFTRFEVKLSPAIFECSAKIAIEDAEWHPLEKLKTLAFSSGHRRILALLLDGAP